LPARLPPHSPQLTAGRRGGALMASSAPSPPQAQPIFSPTQDPTTLRGFFGVFRYSRRALALVRSTNRPLTLALAAGTLVPGVLPAGVAYVGALSVDAVVSAARSGWAARHVLELVALEGVLVAGVSAAQRAIQLCPSLLRAQLGPRGHA